MPPIIEAVRRNATLGEIADAMRRVFGEHQGSQSFRILIWWDGFPVVVFLRHRQACFVAPVFVPVLSIWSLTCEEAKGESDRRF